MLRWIQMVELMAGLLLQGFLAWCIRHGGHPALPPWALPIVLVLGALTLADGLGRFHTETRRVNFWIYFSMSFFVPLYGGLGSLFVAWYRRRESESAHLVGEYMDHIHSEEGKIDDEGDALSSGSVEQMVYRELSIQSYMDIIRGSDRRLKKALIGKILREWTPNAVALLKAALQDDAYEIRSYASTALTTIEDRMSRNIQDLRRNMTAHPDNASAKTKLAQGYLNYAGSGLLDRNSSEHYVRLAFGILEDVGEAAENDGGLRLNILSLRGHGARLLGDTAAEKKAYDGILESHPDHREALGHLCALYFRERNFGALSECCERFLLVTQTDHPAADSAGIWSREHRSDPVGVEP